MLNHHIFPILHRIGFDESISNMVFKIASSSWKLMGPLNEKVIAFHPMVHQQVEEVRQGLEAKSLRNSNMLLRSTSALPKRISGTISGIASPEYLFDLLKEITTPWIILPRAFRFLRKCQCCYLPVYLKIIDRETQELCLRLFSRIAVEFVGNFSLKFADRHHPPDQIAKLLFYGCSALFWKTLRCPPENFENSTAFDFFFNWISMLVRRNDFLGNEQGSSVDHMRKMTAMIFPAKNSGSPQIHCRPDVSRFMVTLRHGCIGTESILKYFGVDQFLENRQIGSWFASPAIQNELQGLLHIIQTKYHSESKQTREYIKLFTGRLRSVYALMQLDSPETGKNHLDRIFNKLQLLMHN
jgi:hypothetical protein